MILDKFLLFSDGQALTASAPSTVIDLQTPGDAVGQELTIRSVVAQEFAGLTSLQIKIQTSDNNSTWEDVLMTPTIAAAKLKQGAEVFCVRVPRGLSRYVRLQYVVAGTATAGKISSFMSKEI